MAKEVKEKSVEKQWVVKSHVHHAMKGTPAKGKVGQPNYEEPIPGEMVKLAPGDDRPAHLVSELMPLGVIAPKGWADKDPNFQSKKGVAVGEPGTAGVFEELPAKDDEDEKPEAGKYAKRK